MSRSLIFFVLSPSFTQEVPTRFKKELLASERRSSNSGGVRFEGMKDLITNKIEVSTIMTTQQQQHSMTTSAGNKKKVVVVVGAGIAGMAATLELRERGGYDEVVLLEAVDSTRAGGRAFQLKRSQRTNDDYADVGTQYFHSNYHRTFRLMEKVGILQSQSRHHKKQVLKIIDGKTRFYTHDGKSFLVDPQIPIIPPLGIWGNIKAIFWMIWLVLRHGIGTFELEDTPSTRYLDQQAALDSIQDPGIRDYIVRCLVLVGALSEPSNVSLLQLVRLIRIILSTDYVSLKQGGTTALHQALAERVQPQLGQSVSELVVVEQDGKSVVQGVRVKKNGTTTTTTIKADHVVVATQPTAAAQLVPSSWTHEKKFLESIEMPPCIIVSFFLNTPSMEDNVWSHFFPLQGERREEDVVSFGIDTMAKNPECCPSGKTTFQAWVVHPHSTRLWNKTDEEIMELVRTNVERYIIGFSKRVDHDTPPVVTRHTHAIPQARLGHNQAALEFLDHVTTHRQGISFCGDYFSGGYLECALWSVDRMLHELDHQ